MNNAAPHSALREWWQHMRAPKLILGLAGATVILAISGPFGTSDVMPLGTRAAYWLGIVVLTYSGGYVSGVFVARRFGRRWPKPAQILVAGLLTGIAAFVVVVAVNWLAFGRFPQTTDLPTLIGSILAIALVLTVLREVLIETAQERHPAAPALLDRLPPGLRAPLVSVSVEDHYVRIRTVEGEEMVLMRLGDAMREAAPVPGLQVHRSHWVALNAITSARREGDRAILTMQAGPEIPVSRRYVPALREAGVL